MALVLFAAGFAAPALANLTDDFNRADNAALGNGWIEKEAANYSIVGNAVQKNAASGSYLNHLAYRPASEDVADVEVSVEFRLSASNPGYPQIYTRVQSDTVAWGTYFNGYMLYVNESNTQAILGRQTESEFVATLQSLTLSPALNTTDTFRLRMRTTGTNPVQLAAYVERLNSGTWQIIGQATYDDTAAGRFTNAGTVGFGGYTEASYRYDNFVRTNLSGGGGGNPLPSTTSLQPNSALAGENGLTLTVNGGSFISGSTVRWNGTDRPTTFISSSVLEAQITAADLATAGNASVTVFTPTPGGGTSNAQAFTITSNPTPNPVPAVTTLAPNNGNAGGAAFTLTVNGSNFASNATVRWNGSNRTTNFVSATQLTATITAADIASVGTGTVTVFNPAPGGGTSNGTTFTINAAPNPVPVASGLNPTSTTAGAGGFTLTVTGSSFVNGATVRWNGGNRTTTFVSATQLTAAINAADVGAAGNQSVTVFNPGPGGGTSNVLTFTVNPGGGGGGTPVINALSPISAAQGASSSTITLNGTGFTSSSVARWNGNNRTTTFLSATQVRFTASSSDLANAGLASVTVNNGGVGGISQPLSFFILASGTSVFQDTFNRANNQNIGNGWTEKTPSAFFIEGNQVANVGNTAPLGYRDTLVYRSSATEDQLNVESSIEFIRSDANFPQVHARVQRSNITTPNIIEGYILYVDDYLEPMALAIAVQPTSTLNECTLQIMNFPTPLVNGTRYRLRFLVQGSYPVQLTGILERFDGNAWQVFVSGTFTHDNNTPMNPSLYCPYDSVPLPITGAGAVGFAKWWDTVDTYDNFHWRGLGNGGSNIPSLTSISPESAAVGGAQFTLTLNGSGFLSNAAVRWNGSNRTTTFVSANQLRATITAADIATAGTAAVTVFNPGTGGGTSPQTQTFTITPPVSAQFLDEFSRADSDSLGNGWIEKAPAAFYLIGGQASKQPYSTNYTNSLVYRPASEDLLNVEAAVQMRLRSSSPGYPQLIARMQSSTAAVDGSFDGYLIFIDNNNSSAYLGRQRGSSLATLGGITISPALNMTDTYRMRMTVTGTSSVQIQAFIERLNGATWQIIGQTSATDTSAQRLSGVGTVGFSGYVENAYTYDNFTRNSLGP